MCPKFNTIPPVLVLKEVSNNIFKSPNLASVQDVQLHVSPELMLGNPDCFLLAARSCDGSYHSVYSEISELLKKNPIQLKKGMIEFFLKQINYNEDLHGKRFLIYKNHKKIYLVGDLISALKRFSVR